jgi:triacylglycerol lipase
MDDSAMASVNRVVKETSSKDESAAASSSSSSSSSSAASDVVLELVPRNLDAVERYLNAYREHFGSSIRGIDWLALKRFGRSFPAPAGVAEGGFERSFNPLHAAYLAFAAALVYANDALLYTVMRFIWSPNVASLDDFALFENAGTATRAFGVCTPHFLLVSYRGTVPGGANWRANLNARKSVPSRKLLGDVDSVDERVFSAVRLHSGFDSSCQTVLPRVLEWIATSRARHGEATPLYIAGHSLGGALALVTYCYCHFRRPRVPVQGIYTMGQPAVLNSDGVALLATAIDSERGQASSSAAQIHRVVHGNDAVPTLPPPWAGFKHAGELTYFTPSGAVRRLVARERRSLLNPMKNQLTTGAVEHHGAQHYCMRTFTLVERSRERVDGGMIDQRCQFTVAVEFHHIEPPQRATWHPALKQSGEWVLHDLTLSHDVVVVQNASAPLARSAPSRQFPSPHFTFAKLFAGDVVKLCLGRPHSYREGARTYRRVAEGWLGPLGIDGPLGAPLATSRARSAPSSSSSLLGNEMSWRPFETRVPLYLVDEAIDAICPIVVGVLVMTLTVRRTCMADARNDDGDHDDHEHRDMVDDGDSARRQLQASKAPRSFGVSLAEQMRVQRADTDGMSLRVPLLLHHLAQTIADRCLGTVGAGVHGGVLGLSDECLTLLATMRTQIASGQSENPFFDEPLFAGVLLGMWMRALPEALLWPSERRRRGLLSYLRWQEVAVVVSEPDFGDAQDIAFEIARSALADLSDCARACVAVIALLAEMMAAAFDSTLMSPRDVAMLLAPYLLSPLNVLGGRRARPTGEVDQWTIDATHFLLTHWRSLLGAELVNVATRSVGIAHHVVDGATPPLLGATFVRKYALHTSSAVPVHVEGRTSLAVTSICALDTAVLCSDASGSVTVFDGPSLARKRRIDFEGVVELSNLVPLGGTERRRSVMAAHADGAFIFDVAKPRHRASLQIERYLAATSCGDPDQYWLGTKQACGLFSFRPTSTDKRDRISIPPSTPRMTLRSLVYVEERAELWAGAMAAPFIYVFDADSGEPKQVLRLPTAAATSLTVYHLAYVRGALGRTPVVQNASSSSSSSSSAGRSAVISFAGPTRSETSLPRAHLVDVWLLPAATDKRRRHRRRSMSEPQKKKKKKKTKKPRAAAGPIELLVSFESTTLAPVLYSHSWFDRHRQQHVGECDTLPCASHTLCSALSAGGALGQSNFGALTSSKSPDDAMASAASRDSNELPGFDITCAAPSLRNSSWLLLGTDSGAVVAWCLDQLMHAPRAALVMAIGAIYVGAQSSPVTALHVGYRSNDDDAPVSMWVGCADGTLSIWQSKLAI